MNVTEQLEAYGHPNIRATHKTTLEITKARDLTLGGDCIVAIRASRSGPNFSRTFRDAIRDDAAKVEVVLEMDGIREVIRGRGNSGLTLGHLTDLVARKSNFVCSRTLMVGADKAASDLSRSFVEFLRRGSKVDVTISVSR